LRRRCHRASPCRRPGKPFPFSIEVLDHAELNAPIRHESAWLQVVQIGRRPVWLAYCADQGGLHEARYHRVSGPTIGCLIRNQSGAQPGKLGRV
jgi:hypothetical protein